MKNKDEDYLLDRIRYSDKVDMQKVLKAAAKLGNENKEQKQKSCVIAWQAIPDPFKRRQE